MASFFPVEEEIYIYKCFFPILLVAQAFWDTDDWQDDCKVMGAKGKHPRGM